MLRFSPDMRISVSDAIKHPYFESFKNLGDPPESDTIFDWSWDSIELTKELLQKIIYMESLCFHPEEEGQETSTTQPPIISNNMIEGSQGLDFLNNRETENPEHRIKENDSSSQSTGLIFGKGHNHNLLKYEESKGPFPEELAID